MADSDFWRELADKFRAIRDDHGLLRIDWNITAKVGEPQSAIRQWCFAAGSVSHSMQLEFEALARRCGRKIRPWMDSREAWLEELITFQSERQAPTFARKFAPDGTVLAHVNHGSILWVCEVSADVCKVFESRALEAERLADLQEEQLEDPRNRSPLRQQWEVYKSIRELIAGPHEEIPEAFIRTALAQQYGVKPEEVTWQQIQFEVSGLLQDFPAIRVIPSPTAAGTEPSPDTRETGNRRERIDAFLEACKKFSRTRIRRRYIWLAVGHTSGRQFEYWQACSDKATGEDNRNFNRILRMQPEAFIALLREKQLIPQDG